MGVRQVRGSMGSAGVSGDDFFECIIQLLGGHPVVLLGGEVCNKTWKRPGEHKSLVPNAIARLGTIVSDRPFRVSW